MTAATFDLDLSPLAPRQFEELVFDVMHAEGWKNLQWRDGGADGGRDVTGATIEIDASGYEEQRDWFCDAKLYSTGIGFEVIQPTLRKGTAHPIDYLLIAVWPHLTPPCKDAVKSWVEHERPRFKVRVWEKKDIEKLLLKHPAVLRRYLPYAWSRQLEMDAFLRHSIEMFRDFKERAAVVWKNVDARPFSDLLRVVPKDQMRAPTVEMVDASQRLNVTERAFMLALVDAHRELELVLLKALNIPSPTTLVRYDWAERAEVRVLVPMPDSEILRTDYGAGLQRVLAMLAGNSEAGHQRGVLAGGSCWRPYRERDRVVAYAFFPDRQDQLSP